MGTCARPYGCGASLTWFNLIWLTSGGGTSGNVDPNSCWWCCWVLVSDAGADKGLYLVEPVLLQLQVVHHVLEMRVGAGMIVR